MAWCDKSQPLTIRIDSHGGVVATATSIHDAIAAWPSKTIGIVESNAYSAGSYILMACDVRQATPHALLMVHEPNIDGGAASDSEREVLSRMRQTLLTAYARRVRGGTAKAEQLLSTDSWMTADEAKQLGLIDRITR
ncbi:ATP-dependent Clp protease proteolytic subunit [Mariniblastus fucicola]|nr:ATP-dependent Clp protease proteolytic subunit [Mariniblastus fucicola]